MPELKAETAEMKYSIINSSNSRNFSVGTKLGHGVTEHQPKGEINVYIKKRDQKTENDF